MKFTVRYLVVREPHDEPMEDWHRAIAGEKCFRLTPGHRSVNWPRYPRPSTTTTAVAVRLEAASLPEAAEAAETCVRRLAAPYEASIVSVEPTAWQNRPIPESPKESDSQ